ncbi:cupin domain-containing protein (plasmid) [Deinococcus psychrotolerans]|uniref:Cupin domain-containing protein n=1 Tax=Deinococcus psychrotolerans TaxID=2489213 RepID=A0A3G8YS20_9DEIO|nr:cupin domain-containing protein [Deinococcus psychrotolerans]AZI44551.1 cupin domain-containing protein [Deinococcus psychrotolerans]
MKRAEPPQIITATPHGRVLRFTFAAGEGVPTHKHPGAQVVVTVLSGQVEVTAEESCTLKAAEILTHDGDQPLSLFATQDSSVVVTLIHR